MEDTLIVLATASPIIAAAAGFFAAAWWSAHRHARRLEHLLQGTLRGEHDDGALDQALRAMEEQLERIREDQEFLARRLTDARAGDALPPLGRPSELTPP